MSFSFGADQRFVDLLALALTLDGTLEERVLAVLEHVRRRLLDDCEAVLVSQDQFDFDARHLILGLPVGAVRADIDASIYQVLRAPGFLQRMDQAFPEWTDRIVRDNGKSSGMWLCDTAAAAGVDVTEWRREQLHPVGIEDVWGATALVGKDSFLSVLIPLHCDRPRPTSDQLQFLLNLPHVLAPILVSKTPCDPTSRVKEAISNGLSEAQARVLSHALSGLTEKEIAHRIHRSQHTVNSHLRAIYRHYNVSTRAELMARAIEGNLKGR
ncbi:response regulator transcription factor [Botrimarina mediterranea]|uniref:Bacterial regulatory protein, luxR family n=1 Tax=Botrimarina mediterranea TaxID=2528022 RepID=A0A518K365_9BACT|nr:helix-turn-helix transcriptional regulator [Botrimarina mediterranea]QDV72246.1 Bacterial regulatory protein, luxR family [Botrimarina mediterranea]